MELCAKLTEYLVTRNRTQLLNILMNPDCIQNYSIVLNFITLLEESIEIGNGLLLQPETYLSALDKAAILAQKNILIDLKKKHSKDAWTIKTKISVRIEGLPMFEGGAFPGSKDIGLFVKINGTLIKAGVPKLLEHQREYNCLKCHSIKTVKADYEKYYNITPPGKCSECNGCNMKQKNEDDVSNFIDYQEVKVQEHFGKSKIGAVPRIISVTLEGDLVDSCKPGDDVIITGTLLRRWKLQKPGARYEINMVLKANHLELSNEQKTLTSNKEVKENFCNFWKNYRHSELFGRNHILKSFCPQIFGLNLVKLAMVTVLAGGVKKSDENGSSARGMSHLLLIGDAGTGKSHLLRYASKIFPNSVLTTGVGSTTAGLTVTAIRENGDWNLEAGALVLADGGLCCIDDFNSVREHDRTSIHEAMEQQSISVAKAGIVTKLHTRCSIFATTNTGGKANSVPLDMVISSPLLSRFDIVLVLSDSKSSQWDRCLCDFILKDRRSFRESLEQHPNKAEALVNLIWSISDLQNYFSVIKDINPVMSEEAGTTLRTYYQFQRMVDRRNAARTTVRLLESLIRLSQGHARLMFREKVTVLDAITAIQLVESSLLNVGNSKINALYTLTLENPYEEYKAQVSSILTMLQLESFLDNELKNIQNALLCHDKMKFTDYSVKPMSINDSESSISATYCDKTQTTLKRSNKGKDNLSLEINEVIPNPKSSSRSGKKYEIRETNNHNSSFASSEWVLDSSKCFQQNSFHQSDDFNDFKFDCDSCSGKKGFSQTDNHIKKKRRNIFAAADECDDDWRFLEI